MHSGGAQTARKICTKTVEDGCPHCRCIRRMAVRTLIGSAIQERPALCFINRSTRQRHGLQKIFLTIDSPCSSLHPEVLASYHFQGSSSVEPLSSRISAAASAGKCNAFDAICHHFNKNWQESVPVTGISNIQNSKRSKRPLAMASPVQHAL